MIFIPIIIFAIPLIWFLAVNKGIIEKTDFGIFTAPKLFLFRQNEISISNVFKSGLFSLETIFLSPNTLYYFEIPIFIIGIIEGIKKTIQTIKKKEYSFLALMTLTFFSILIINILVEITATNRVNILYIIILYFIAIGLIEIFKNKKILWIIVLIIYILAFVGFEIYYYTEYGPKEQGIYTDISLTKIMDDIGKKDLREKEIYVFTFDKAEPYIYFLINDKISPKEFYDSWRAEEQENDKGIYKKTVQFSNYHFNDTNNINEYDENKIYIVNKKWEPIIKILEKFDYEKKEIDDYYIFNKTI